MKVKLDLYMRDLNWNDPLHTDKFADLIYHNCGVTLVKSGSADLVFRDTRLKPTDEPTIVYDRWDTSTLTERTATKWDSLPSTLGYVVPTKCKTKDGFWNFGRGETAKPVYLMTNMLWAQCKAPWFQEFPKYTEKDIDVLFAGTMRYEDIPAVEEHRQGLLKQWHTLSGLESRGVFGRVIPWEKSYELSVRAKVMVSPWGVTELSWRDYEAVLAGCMIVKPRCYVDVWPSPWNIHNTVVCEPDFSDLWDAVGLALDRYDPAKLYDHRRWIYDIGMDDIQLAAQFAGILQAFKSLASVA